MENRDITDSYRRYLALKGLKTIDEHLATVERFCAFLAGAGKNWKRASSTDAENWKLSLVNAAESPSNGTVNNLLNRVRSFYRYCLLKKLVLADPFRATTNLKTARSLPKVILSIADTGRLLECFSRRDHGDVMVKTVIELLYGCALRINEAATIKLCDIDRTRGSLRVDDSKTGKERTLPMGEVTMRQVDIYLENSREKIITEDEKAAGFLFPQGGTSRLRCRVNRVLARECGRLGLPVVTSHSFRHAAASHMLSRGAGIREVQAFLGHERISTTEIYTRVVKDDLRAVVRLCHPREQGGA